MRRHLVLLSAVLVTAIASLGLVAGVASAAGTATAPTQPAGSTTSTTTTTPTTPTTPTAPAPTPPAVAGSARVLLLNAFFVKGNALMVPGRALQVTGIVRPYVAGQKVAVTAAFGTHGFATQTVRVKPSRNHQFGVATATIKAPHAGLVHIELTHQRTAQMLGFTVGRGVRAVATSVGFGAKGAFVSLIQQRLAALHIYVPQTGVYDTQTGLAVDAYHRLLRQGFSQLLNAQTVSELLSGQGAFKVRYPGDGKHVEANLTTQLLALINGSKVYAIYPISSGKPSTPTVLGRFSVYRRVPGLQSDGMYYSDYFYTGYAIHGYDPAPDYPASHGCLRLPIIDATSVWNWLTIGVRVDVYYP